jgi:hypothetical protein
VVLAALLALQAWRSVGAELAAANGPKPGRDVPTATGAMSQVPLGHPALAPLGHGGFAFMQMQDDGVTPVAFDPCRPVHYVVRNQDTPQGARELLDWALGRLSYATGLRFVDDGATPEAPSERRAVYQPERYGDRWAPVLIAWSTPSEWHELSGDVLGRAGPWTFGTSRPGSLRYVSGQAVFNAPAIDRLLRTGRDGYVRAVLLHELGHLVGLDHVSDPYQVMYGVNSVPLDSYRDGDLRGLEQLGRGRCFPDY